MSQPEILRPEIVFLPMLPKDQRPQEQYILKEVVGSLKKKSAGMDCNVLEPLCLYDQHGGFKYADPYGYAVQKKLSDLGIGNDNAITICAGSDQIMDCHFMQGSKIAIVDMAVDSIVMALNPLARNRPMDADHILANLRANMLVTTADNLKACTDMHNDPRICIVPEMPFARMDAARRNMSADGKGILAVVLPLPTDRETDRAAQLELAGTVKALRETQDYHVVLVEHPKSRDYNFTNALQNAMENICQAKADIIEACNQVSQPHIPSAVRYFYPESHDLLVIGGATREERHDLRRSAQENCADLIADGILARYGMPKPVFT